MKAIIWDLDGTLIDSYDVISRSIRDAFKSVIRNFSLSLASISCITITLVVVAISIVLSYNVEKMTEHVSSNISIVAFLNGESDSDKVKEIESQLKKIDNVDKISFKSKNVEFSCIAFCKAVVNPSLNPVMFPLVSLTAY